MLVGTVADVWIQNSENQEAAQGKATPTPFLSIREITALYVSCAHSKTALLSSMHHPQTWTMTDTKTHFALSWLICCTILFLRGTRKGYYYFFSFCFCNHTPASSIRICLHENNRLLIQTRELARLSDLTYLSNSYHAHTTLLPQVLCVTSSYSPFTQTYPKSSE